MEDFKVVCIAVSERRGTSLSLLRWGCGWAQTQRLKQVFAEASLGNAYTPSEKHCLTCGFSMLYLGRDLIFLDLGYVIWNWIYLEIEGIVIGGKNKPKYNALYLVLYLFEKNYQTSSCFSLLVFGWVTLNFISFENNLHVLIILKWLHFM